MGLHPNFLLDAYSFLAGNPKATRTIFGSPWAGRMELLTKIMNNHGIVDTRQTELKICRFAEQCRIIFIAITFQ